MLHSSETPFDLFISYSHKDNADGRVTQLVDSIRAAHRAFSTRPLNVFFDTAAIQTMQDWELRILSGLKQSKMMLAVLSPNYFASQYCRKEWRVFLEHEIARAMFGQSVGPIYYVQLPWLPPSQPPVDVPAEMRAWFDDIRARQFAIPEPWFDRGAEALQAADIREQLDKLARQIDVTVERVERGSQSPTTVPAYNRNFVGRVNDLREVRAMLEQNPVGAIIGVQGIGGIGKSELAFAYAHAFADAYPGGRFLVGCEGVGDLRDALIKLADTTPELGLTLTPDDRNEQNRDHTAAKVRAALLARPATLLILDNVDRPSLLSPAVRDQVLPDRRQIHLLVTTRNDPSELPEVKCKDVDALEPDDAIRLIESHFETHEPRRTVTEGDFQALAGIVQRLGGHPLACEVVAVYLCKHPQTSCRDYLQWLDEELLAALDSAGQDPKVQLKRHPTKLLEPLLRSTLAGLSAEARVALEYAALLPPDQIPVAWLHMLCAAECPVLQADVPRGRPNPWDEVVQHLLGLRLLVDRDSGETARDLPFDERYCRSHRLLQEVIRAGMTPEQTAYRERMLRALLDQRCVALQRSHLPPEVLPEFDALHALLELRRKMDDAEIGRSLVAFSGLLARRGNSAAAVQYARDSVRQLEARHAAAPENADYARDLSVSYNNMGDLFRALGDSRGAREFYEKDLAIAERLAAAAPENADYARDLSVSYNKMGDLFGALGDGRGAREFYEKALSVSERLAAAAPENADYARDLSVSYERMGDLFRALGDSRGAREFYEKSLSVRERLAAAAPENADYARDLSVSYNKMGDLFGALGDGRGAREFYEKSLSVRERLAAAAPENAVAQRDLAISYERIAGLEAEAENWSEARRLYELELAIAERLHERSPEDAGWPRFRALVHLQLMQVVAQLDDMGEAQRHLLTAAGLMQTKIERGMELEEQDRQLLGQIQAIIERLSGGASSDSS